MRLSISFAFLLATACGDGVHSDPQEVVTNPDSGGSGGSDSGSDMSADEPDANHADASVSPLCAEPEGPLHPYTQDVEVRELIVGKWLHCSGRTILQNEQAGVEFVSDGTYFMLAYDGGNLVRLTGFGKQGTWDATQETPTAVQFDWHPAPNSGNGGFPVFEDNPRRFAIDFYPGPGDSIYIIAH